MTKYKSISFSAPMVRANRVGLKTVTRRLMKPQPPFFEYPDGTREPAISKLHIGHFHPVRIDGDGIEEPGPEIFGVYDDSGEFGWKCPFVPGEIRWVREAWRTYACWDDRAPRNIPGQHCWNEREWPIWYEATGDPEDRYRSLFGRLRPAMFMCRWMARDCIRILDVRPERVQDITEDEAKREGVREPSLRDLGGDLAQAAWSERQVFARLWSHIHGPSAWDRNDYVYRIQYERCEKPEGA